MTPHTPDAPQPTHSMDLDLHGQIDALRALVQGHSLLMDALAAAESMALPHWYIGAGCVTQTAWNAMTGHPHGENIKDIDLVYFDPTSLDGSDEIRHEAHFRSLLGDVPFDLDVKNQARVHTWYSDYFGYPIPPYTSTEAAIATWPTTASSIGLRKQGDDWKLCAPFGLRDLLGMIVRPNKAQITEEIYQKKVARWHRCWPQLTIIPWSQV